MINPLLLRTLSVVLETGSFANAARAMGYTASAVSQQIMTLERAVGVKLFEREAQSISPTAAATFLAGRGKEVVASLEALMLDMQLLASGHLGSLRIGSFPTAGQRVVPTALSALIQERPTTQVHLDEGEPDELLPELLDGHLDVILVYRYDLVPRNWPTGLTETALLAEDLIVVLPSDHPSCGRGPVAIADLAEEHWISSNENSAGAICLASLCAAAGFAPRVDFRSNDYNVVRGLVQAGLGIALIPALGYQPTAGISSTVLTEPRQHRYVSALHRDGNSNPILPLALDRLRRAAEQVEPWIQSY